MWVRLQHAANLHTLCVLQVSRGSLTALRAAAGPSRLGLSQPGSPVTGSAGGSGSGASAGIEATVLRMQGNAARADARTGGCNTFVHGSWLSKGLRHLCASFAEC